MKGTLTLLVCVVVGVCFGSSIRISTHPTLISLKDGFPIVNEKQIQHINDLQTSWKAGVNTRLNGLSIKDFKRLLGAKVETASPFPIKEVEIPQNLPTNFDARQTWSHCPTIGTIYDQGHCGSCWACACAETLSDRFCIQGAGTVALSPQDLVSCDTNGNDGCGGGSAYAAWEYTKFHGIPDLTCYPYFMGSCQHPGCSEWPTPACNETCQNNTRMTYYYSESVYGIQSNSTHMQAEIMQNGPIEVTFAVYEDFANYKSGVYVHKTGDLLGYHSVKAIGWGFDKPSGLDYWLIVNSWNDSWGMNGLFMIQRGVNMCGIESNPVAGLANTSNL
eukprot:TRINITY_DN1100_c0_g1_i1.p1 TRINITY_DN1100_c0_g1~~TRINITY_DN1100_c0_g1_i1.p1  ORF type:complete len:332 (+),score=48.49 TRINITY_DN1100_c0_g1_i1:162-1157(+)